MSSMGSKSLVSFVFLAGSALASPAFAQTIEVPQRTMVAQQPTRMAAALSQWEYLTKTDNLSFSQYAGFLSTYPNFPKAELIQRRAEAALVPGGAPAT